jgi:hypothetical protein
VTIFAMDAVTMNRAMVDRSQISPGGSRAVSRAADRMSNDVVPLANRQRSFTQKE